MSDQPTATQALPTAEAQLTDVSPCDLAEALADAAIDTTTKQPLSTKADALIKPPSDSSPSLPRPDSLNLSKNINSKNTFYTDEPSPDEKRRSTFYVSSDNPEKISMEDKPSSVTDASDQEALDLDYVSVDSSSVPKLVDNNVTASSSSIDNSNTPPSVLSLLSVAYEEFGFISNAAIYKLRGRHRLSVVQTLEDGVTRNTLRSVGADSLLTTEELKVSY